MMCLLCYVQISFVCHCCVADHSLFKYNMGQEETIKMAAEISVGVEEVGTVCPGSRRQPPSANLPPSPKRMMECINYHLGKQGQGFWLN